MKLYVDLDTLQFIEGPGFRSPLTAIRFKRGDAARLDVQFLEGGTTPVSIGNPATVELAFGAKAAAAYSSGYLVLETAWTMPAAPPAVQTYSCEPSFNTAELDAAIGVGGAELSELELMGEITFRVGGGAPTSTATLRVVVDNDVNRGTEGTPMSLPTPAAWLAERSDIKLIYGVPEANPIYDITLAGKVRTLAFVNGTNWNDGIKDSPYLSITITPDGFGGFVLDDLENGNSWSCATASNPGDAMWSLSAGSSTETPLVLESTQFPRFFHEWPSSRTWIVPSASGDFVEIVMSNFTAICTALNYAPANDANVVHKSGTETIAGSKTFSGQVELTGQTATNGTSAMTRDLVRKQSHLLDSYDNWELFGSLNGMYSGGATGTGAYATAGQAQAGSSIGGWARMVLAAYTTRPSGAGANNGLCSVPIAVSAVGTFSVSDGSAVRIFFGAKSSGTPYWSNQNPLIARGFGVEIYSVSGVAKMRLFTHNGTTFNYGTAANFAGIWTGICHLVIASNGAGRVQCWHAGSDSHVALGTPTLQSAMTLNAGPTSGTYGEEGVVTMEAVGNNAIASSALGNIIRGKMYLNHQL